MPNEARVRCCPPPPDSLWASRATFQNCVAIKLRTIRRNLWRVDSNTGSGGRFSQALPQSIACSLRSPIRDQDLVDPPANFQSPTLKPTWQRCKWRLVFEWVCTVTSISVRIEKRAKCAKNDKPKSGGLFVVNTRPFPQHSWSVVTFSAGRAWLKAIPLNTLESEMHKS